MGRNFGRKNIIKTDNRGGRQSYNQHDDRGYNVNNRDHHRDRDRDRDNHRTWNGDNRRNKHPVGRSRSFRGRGGRGKSYILPGRLGGSLHGTSTSNRPFWTKVIFMNMVNHDKVEFIKRVVELTHEKVLPIYYCKQGPHFVFYVQSKDEVQSLRNVEKNLGIGINMRMENQSPPDTHLTLNCERKNYRNFIDLVPKTPNVKIFYLNDNLIHDFEELEKVKAWPLVNLRLEGNPLIRKFRDNTSYISAVRKLFPRLTHLDGSELPRLITFDDDDVNSTVNVSIPPSIPKMVYDSDNRQGLMDAYHEDAMMSISASYPLDGHKSHYTKLDEYFSDSRNLIRISDSNRRLKALRQGRFTVVSFINSLPKTLHHPDTITLDVPFATERLMTFTVTGLFKEREKKGEPIRHFNRMFVVVPQGSGFVIINDLLYITNPPKEKADIPFPVVPDNSAKEFKASQISQKTGMTINWSIKCLEQTNWDVNQALAAFETAKSQGKNTSRCFSICIMINKL
ncbi:NXF [Lepeophtheirus salmonis]|uniref:NXF n=1 Tax=Lepeophtheirus salmonis TaxID=72036 RepID=A0A7R8CVP9_LEPSM|nr:NXF [Lepeophtheirus salmonis]CAF2945370.1 NXF [Lepeophtheirus salmonis]